MRLSTRRASGQDRDFEPSIEVLPWLLIKCYFVLLIEIYVEVNLTTIFCSLHPRWSFICIYPLDLLVVPKFHSIYKAFDSTGTTPCQYRFTNFRIFNLLFFPSIYILSGAFAPSCSQNNSCTYNLTSNVSQRRQLKELVHEAMQCIFIKQVCLK